MRTLAALVLVWLACSTEAAPREIEGASFSFPLPSGYTDITGDLRKDESTARLVAVAADKRTSGVQATITVQPSRRQVHTEDVATCSETGRSIASGVNGRLEDASMVAGPAGPACLMHIVSPEGVAIITELNRGSETWLMTCNHADGDTEAEKVCRATLAAFRFKK